MEKSLTPKRWHQIAVAIFDCYVANRMIENDFVVTEKGINDQDLCNFAVQAECEPGSLRAAIVNSCTRIAGDHFNIPISEEKEKKVLEAVIKMYLKEVPLSLINYKREIGKIISKIKKNSAINVTVEEFKTFIGPLHQRVIVEFYNL